MKNKEEILDYIMTHIPNDARRNYLLMLYQFNYNNQNIIDNVFILLEKLNKIKLHEEEELSNI